MWFLVGQAQTITKLLDKGLGREFYWNSFAGHKSVRQDGQRQASPKAAMVPLEIRGALAKGHQPGNALAGKQTGYLAFIRRKNFHALQSQELRVYTV